MKQEDKDLLLKDLCARLPYGLICHYNAAIPMLGEVINNGELQEIKYKGESFVVNGADCLYDDIKPYLRPMSSMTEEEKEYIQTCFDIITDENYGDGYSPSAWDAINNFTNYCDSRHLDHRGLIWRELALPAPEGMYK